MQPADDRDVTRTIPMVHMTPSRSQSISFQSLFQPVPQLYKYSADQLQIVIQRRSGEIEHLPKDKPALGENGLKAGGRTRNGRRRDIKIDPVKSIADEHIDTNPGDTAPCFNDAGTALACSTISTGEESGDLHPNLHEIRATCSSKASTSSECSSCDALLTLLGDSEAEASQLRESLQANNKKLIESQNRVVELMKENQRLLAAFRGIKKGMNDLTRFLKFSNATSEMNDRRIMELLNGCTETTFSKTHASLKSIDSSLDRMRDHVCRLNVVPNYNMNSLSEDPMTRDSSLSYTVNIISRNDN